MSCLVAICSLTLHNYLVLTLVYVLHCPSVKVVKESRLKCEIQMQDVETVVVLSGESDHQGQMFET